MSFGTLLYTLFFGTEVGQDEFGNRYYRERGRPGRKRERRWVIYKGSPEATKVPPLWHGWLHGTLKDPPEQGKSRIYAWQKPHQPNRTGTPLAYLPGGHPSKGKARSDMMDYESWSPDQGR